MNRLWTKCPGRGGRDVDGRMSHTFDVAWILDIKLLTAVGTCRRCLKYLLATARAFNLAHSCPHVLSRSPQAFGLTHRDRVEAIPGTSTQHANQEGERPIKRRNDSAEWARGVRHEFHLSIKRLNGRVDSRFPLLQSGPVASNNRHWIWYRNRSPKSR